MRRVPPRAAAGRAGGQGEDHRVGVDQFLRRRRSDREPPANPGTRRGRGRRRGWGWGQRPGHRGRPDLRARSLGQEGRQQAQSPGERGENRPAGPGAGRCPVLTPGRNRDRWREQRACRLRQRPVAPRRGGQRRHRRVEGQVRGTSRVHPAEQRVDQPVDDLRAEPGSDVIRHRHVAIPNRRRQLEVLAGPGRTFAGHHPRPGQFGQVGRDAHELAAGQRAERAERPDRRGRGSRIHAVTGQPDLGDELGSLRPGDEQRLGSLVDRDAGHLGDDQLAARPG